MPTAAINDTDVPGKTSLDTTPKTLWLKLADGDHCFDATSAAGKLLFEDVTDISAFVYSESEEDDRVMLVDNGDRSSSEGSNGLGLCGCSTADGDAPTDGSRCDDHPAPTPTEYFYQDEISSIVAHEGKGVPRKYLDYQNDFISTTIALGSRVESGATGALASTYDSLGLNDKPATGPCFSEGSVKLTRLPDTKHFQSEALPLGEWEVVIRLEHSTELDERGNNKVLCEAQGIARIGRRVLVDGSAMSTSWGG
ncbi:hypothetical protein JCM24511_07100 [Saitozyma sp. JCM 24511]|nr:hypothetical protein JCM24511_07100 [Saitozyma sp. JCM 24511]